MTEVPTTSGLSRLSFTLIGLYSSLPDARTLAERAGLRLANIVLSEPARVYMWNIVTEAEKTGNLERLIDVALEDYPGQENLVEARKHQFERLTQPVQPPPVPSDAWQPRLGLRRAEKLMGATSTFLPISFLEVGLTRSRAVARVVLQDLATGTGFLVDNELLVTNHHVIPDEATAEHARVQFNFQETTQGRPADVEEFSLDPDAGFATSPMDGGHDYTIVRLAGCANDTWGALPLSNSQVAVEDRVTIVQHPEGGFKKIALHRNLVSYVDDNVLQYYTDTLPGSSGSPVFDQSWRVVALHHAGGELAEPGSGTSVVRNEGVNIAWVAAAIQGL
jgi:V8-like Glu-specific endopeptidase